MKDKNEAQPPQQTAKITNYLARAMASDKQEGLFDLEGEEATEETTALIAAAKEDKHCHIKQGKAVPYSNPTQKVIWGLSYLITTKGGDDIDKICKLYEEGKPLEAGKFEPIVRDIDLAELSDILYKRKSSVQKDMLLRELWRLHSTPCVMFYTYTDERQRKRTRRTIEPLIIFKGGEDEPKSEKGFVRLMFGRPFFQSLNESYGYIHPKLFEIWGRQGSGTNTELFSMLLAELHAAHYPRKKQAMAAAKAARAAAKAEDPNADLNVAAEAARRKALTFEMTFEKIFAKIKTEYEVKRRWDRFLEDLQKAIAALKEYGIITGAKVRQPSKDKAGKVSFLLNFEHRCGSFDEPNVEDVEAEEI